MHTEYLQSGIFSGNGDEHLQEKTKTIKISNLHDFIYPGEHVVLFASVKVCCTPSMFP